MHRNICCRRLFISRTIVLYLFSLIFLAGCVPLASRSTPTSTPTATQPPPPTSTFTPQPTGTPTPTSTPQPTATPTIDRTATAVAQVNATKEAWAARITLDLERYKVDPGQGMLVWLGDQSVNLSADSYMEVGYQTLEGLGRISDFVIQSDITWSSTSGLAGCGFIFRSEDDVEKGAQYRFTLIRLQNMPIWDLSFYQYGQFQYAINPESFISGAIYDQQDSTNRVAIIAQGADISIYVNGERLGKMNNSKMKEGLLAFMINQESGTTHCRFANTWVWTNQQQHRNGQISHDTHPAKNDPL